MELCDSRINLNTVLVVEFSLLWSYRNPFLRCLHNPRVVVVVIFGRDSRF